MSFDGQNIIQKNLHSILQCEDALEKVELFDRAGYRDIGTALFAFVGAKKVMEISGFSERCSRSC